MVTKLGRLFYRTLEEFSLFTLNKKIQRAWKFSSGSTVKHSWNTSGGLKIIQEVVLLCICTIKSHLQDTWVTTTYPKNINSVNHDYSTSHLELFVNFRIIQSICTGIKLIIESSTELAKQSDHQCLQHGSKQKSVMPSLSLTVRLISHWKSSVGALICTQLLGNIQIRNWLKIISTSNNNCEKGVLWPALYRKSG